MAARVLLADDDVELARMLRDYLGREGFAVTCVHDGRSAVDNALSQAYDVMVLDVMMPQMDGIEALRRIRTTSAIPVLMLTGRGDDVDRILGLELGADDYIPKPCTPRELAARIRAVLRRLESKPPGAPLKIGALALWPERRRVECEGRPLTLTSAEFEILHLLMSNAGRLVAKKEIAEKALGRPLARFDRSIDVHMSSIRQKLDAHGSLIHTVRGRGYQFEKE